MGSTSTLGLDLVNPRKHRERAQFLPLKLCPLNDLLIVYNYKIQIISNYPSVTCNTE